MSERVTYLMPIESTNRELAYKLVLAAKLKAPHRQFVFFRPDLGDTMVRLTRAGVWVGQNIRARTANGDDYTRYRQMKAAGFAVVYVDEEGAIYPGDEDTWAKHLRARVDPSLLADDDVLVGWGDFQRDIWSSVPNVTAQVVATGHPRFDLCRRPLGGIYDDEVERIRAKHGGFILINTNFATANYVGGLGGLFNRKDGYAPEDNGARLEFVAAWQRALTSVGEIVATTHKLAARFPRTRFVLRPHPVENHDLYKQVLAGVPNVAVQYDGTAVAWIRAASAVIHNGCTTAIEAYLASTPVIAYCPPSIGDGESWVPNAFSVRAESFDELARCVGLVVANDPPAAPRATAQQQRAHKLLSQLAITPGTEGDASAFAGIVAAIERIEPRLRAREPRFRDGPAKLAAEAHGAGARAKAVARRVQEAARTPLGGPPKFQPFTREHIEDACARVGKATSTQLDVDLLSNTACVIR